jgi:hypothetical protein
MADRRTQPRQQTSFAVTAAVFLATAIIISAPTLAASDRHMPCADNAQAADLEVPVQALVAQLVNNDIPSPSTSILAPLAEAAIREAFGDKEGEIKLPAADLARATVAPPMAGTDSNSVAPSNDADNNDSLVPAPDMNTRLPGVSDEALSRYKKQMYRRDI